MRRIYEQILKDHFQRNRQAAFVCGPRQVGKTTLVQQYAESQPYSLYLNWDRIEDRAKILSPKYANVLEGVPLTPAYKPVIIFDEIHKFKDWKNYVKGFIDTYEKDLQIIVTGSAKLNVFRKGGDSQMGRYLLYRVHPLTIGELGNRDPLALLSEPFSLSKEILNNLMQFGGFPEPFTKTDPRFFKQWQQLRDQQLIVEDIQGIEKIQQIAQLELLSYLLRSQVGQLVNYSNLASKVRVSDPTIRRWMTTLETFYYIFTLKPWSHNVARSLIKEPKVYLWDWSLVEDSGARVENFVASHLLKAVHYWTDIGLGKFGLYFVRTKEKKEVDFLITQSEKPWILIEVKSSDNHSMNTALIEFQKALKVPFAYQLAFNLDSTERALEYLQKTIIGNPNKPQEPAILPVSSFLSMFV